MMQEAKLRKEVGVDPVVLEMVALSAQVAGP